MTDTIFEQIMSIRDNLLYLIPDFHMRLKIEPKTQKTVFAANIRSVFDIACYTLARLLVDVRLTDEGSTERHFNTATVGVCKCCGHAFVKSGKQNRKEYCGRPECQKERVRRKR